MMAAATAVVNSSVSEGVCGVLLESMLLGVPVVGRRNAGNSALIQHEVNGLLYDTPTEGIAQCLRLLTGRLHVSQSNLLGHSDYSFS
eukprot:m.102962 g.102962  ORF g.102962 m.102962 type:complete len:87 (-) comp15204_c0_seq6:1437-1697(-)